MTTQIQITKGSFVERSSITDTNINFIQEVNNVLDAGGFIDPNTELYQNAVSQYNEELKKGQMVRLAIPAGYCGYRDPKIDRFRVIPDPDSSNLVPGHVTENESVYIAQHENVGEKEYPKDTCLQLGLPGSPEYDECNKSRVDEFAVQHDIQWDEDDTEFDSIVTAITDSVEGEAGGTGGGSGYWGAPYSGGSQTVTISNVKAGSGGVSWSGGPTNWANDGDAGSNGTIHFYRRLDNDEWIGGKFEWFRQASRQVSTKNIYNRYNGHTVPTRKGEQVGIMLVSTDGSKRSNLAITTWS